MIFVSAIGHAHVVPRRPDPSLTTGSLCDEANPDYIGRHYPGRVAKCNRNVTYELKTQIYNAYNIPQKCRRSYTIDHLIPLSIGGTNHIDNLWPEHVDIKKTRFELEFEVYKELRDGQINQRSAVFEILDAKKNPDLSGVQFKPCE